MFDEDTLAVAQTVKIMLEELKDKARNLPNFVIQDDVKPDLSAKWEKSYLETINELREKSTDSLGALSLAVFGALEGLLHHYFECIFKISHESQLQNLVEAKLIEKTEPKQVVILLKSIDLQIMMIDDVFFPTTPYRG